MIYHSRHEDIDFCVKSNSKVVPTEKVECYPLIKCFGKTIIRRFQLKVSIPVGDFVNGNVMESGLAFREILR